MTDSESETTPDSSDETANHDRERIDLETLRRDEEWSDEAFRDAGEATFGSG